MTTPPFSYHIIINVYNVFYIYLCLCIVLSFCLFFCLSDCCCLFDVRVFALRFFSLKVCERAKFCFVFCLFVCLLLCFVCSFCGIILNSLFVYFLARQTISSLFVFVLVSRW